MTYEDYLTRWKTKYSYAKTVREWATIYGKKKMITIYKLSEDQFNSKLSLLNELEQRYLNGEHRVSDWIKRVKLELCCEI